MLYLYLQASVDMTAPSAHTFIAWQAIVPDIVNDGIHECNLTRLSLFSIATSELMSWCRDAFVSCLNAIERESPWNWIVILIYGCLEVSFCYAGASRSSVKKVPQALSLAVLLGLAPISFWETWQQSHGTDKVYICRKHAFGRAPICCKLVLTLRHSASLNSFRNAWIRNKTTLLINNGNVSSLNQDQTPGCECLFEPTILYIGVKSFAVILKLTISIWRLSDLWILNHILYPLSGTLGPLWD